MILRSLTLKNFGTYAGVQSLNLEPNGHRNVVLIGGKNGAGKSTFLEAIRLCLYGPHATRGTVSRDKYERYLLERIHRDSSTSVPSVSASIQVEFTYADHDATKTYQAFREWGRQPNGGIQETFELTSDGHPVSDIDSSHWQDFIQELMPIGVSDLFFFDGEKVQLLAEDESDRKTLSEAVRNLLGTDIIEKLSADLTIFRSRAVIRTDMEAKTAADLKRLGDEVQELQAQREILEREAQAARTEADTALLSIQTLERQMQEQGGAYARNRGSLEEKKKQIASRVSLLEGSIREASQGLLPVALAPKLLRSLLNQLDMEQDVRVGVVVDDALAQVGKATLAELRRVSIKRGTKEIPLSSLPEFSSIASVIKKTHQPKLWNDHPVIHDLSSNQEQQVRGWASAALDTIPSSLHAIGEELEGLYRDQQNAERDLARIPSDEVLSPLIEELRKARTRSTNVLVHSAQKTSALSDHAKKQQEAESAYSKQLESIASSNSKRDSLERALAIQLVLKEFKDALVAKKIKDVELEVTRCFNLLSRKKINRSIAINPVSFEVSIRDRYSRVIDKRELSAGEKQIYAISVLWALARVSGRPLPMIIDTPMARLDRDHRMLLGRQYFPNASHQLILLSTDSEVDTQFLPILAGNIARMYELRYDIRSQSTQIEEGYFSGGEPDALH